MGSSTSDVTFELYLGVWILNGRFNPKEMLDRENYRYRSYTVRAAISLCCFSHRNRPWYSWISVANPAQ